MSEPRVSVRFKPEYGDIFAEVFESEREEPVLDARMSDDVVAAAAQYVMKEFNGSYYIDVETRYGTRTLMVTVEDVRHYDPGAL